MPTECTPDLLEFHPVEGRKVVAAFCFDDRRRPDLIEHEVVTLVGQRIFGIALGYEDPNDHDELSHDPIMAVLAGKLEKKRNTPSWGNRPMS